MRNRDTARSVAVKPRRADQHDGSALLDHGLIVGVPVVMRASRSREYLTQQQAESLAIEAGVGVARTKQFSLTFDCRPLPSGPERDAQLWSAPKVGQLRLSIGGKPDDIDTTDRVGQDAGIDDRGLDGAIESQGRYDSQEAVLATNVDHICECRHARIVGRLRIPWTGGPVAERAGLSRCHCYSLGTHQTWLRSGPKRGAPTRVRDKG
jgi:hypothetical protein